VADVDYGQETLTYIVAARCSAMGGWSPVSLDFAPTGGEQASTNYRLWGGTGEWYGQEEFFNLEIIGDDDTLVWIGSAYDTPGSGGDQWVQSRGGYMGMLQRRSPSITYPFFFKAGSLQDLSVSSADRAINSRNDTNVTFEWNTSTSTTTGPYWPSYSLWKDGTRITAHRNDTWYNSTLSRNGKHIETGEDVLWGMLVAQWQSPNKFAIIGEYRFLAAVASDWGRHEVRGTDPQWIQFCHDPLSYNGVVMRWPVGEIPIW